MKDEDEKKITGNIVKVKYSFDHPSQREGTNIIICFTGIALALTVTISAIVNPRTIQSLYLGFIYFGFLLFVSVPQLISERNERLAQKREHEEAVARGKKIIGTIVSLAATELGSNSANGRNFSYTIEYEDSEHGDELVSINTPSAISENMCITEENLPLKAIVYVYKGKGYIDAVVDPPIMQMVARKTIKKSPLIAMFMLLVLCIVFYSIGQVMVSGIFFILGFAVLIIYIHYQQTHR